MCESQEELRAVEQARRMALAVSYSDAADISLEGKRLCVVLEYLRSHCHCDRAAAIGEAYEASRTVYLAHSIREAHSAARRVATILARVA
jgi:hypothetical protein